MKTYKEDDEVIFHINGPIEHKVERDYLRHRHGVNSIIFQQLDIDDSSTFCSNAYGYKAGEGYCPTYKSGDYAAASRLIEALHVKCNGKRLKIAKERYPVGTTYICAYSAIKGHPHEYKVGEQSFSIPDEYQVYGYPGEGCLYYQGKWAEIVSKPDDDIPTPEKPKPMFKVGDKVLITKSHKNWSSSMDQYCGKIATLTSICDSGSFKIDIDGEYWHWNYGDGHFVKHLITSEEPTFPEEATKDEVKRLYPVGTEFYPIFSDGEEYGNSYVVKPEDKLLGSNSSSWFNISSVNSHPGYVYHTGKYARIVIAKDLTGEFVRRKDGEIDRISSLYMEDGVKLYRLQSSVEKLPIDQFTLLPKFTGKYKVGDEVMLTKGYRCVNPQKVTIAQVNENSYHLVDWSGDFPEDILQSITKSAEPPTVTSTTAHIITQTLSSNHKFKVGDRVKAVKSGSGVAPDEVGSIVEIVELGKYSDQPGYRVNPPIGNSKKGAYDFMIGESSFIRIDDAPLKVIDNQKPDELEVVTPIPSNTVIGSTLIKKVSFTRI